MIAITPMPPTISAIDEITTSARNVAWQIWSHSWQHRVLGDEVEVVRLVEREAVADAHHRSTSAIASAASRPRAAGRRSDMRNDAAELPRRR